MRFLSTLFFALVILCSTFICSAEQIHLIVQRQPSPFTISGLTEIIVAPATAPSTDVSITVTCDNPKVHVINGFVLPKGSLDSIIMVVTADEPGIALIKILHDKDLLASFDIQVIKHNWLILFNDVVGWIYFLAWSISFYPQVWVNFVRKSVIGLSFDFLLLNIIGWICYGAFNIGLYSVPIVKREYQAIHPGSSIPVQPNDVFFAVHAFVLTAITIAQCFVYERGNQRVSIPVWGIVTAVVVFQLCSFFSVLFGSHDVLTFLTWTSFVKLGITLVKYIPQAYLNFVRKSTVGWSIGNILLDCTGGVLSMLQMTLIAYNVNDWTGFFGNPTKFGLGLFSVAFDILFILQHYLFYRNAQYKEITIEDETAKASETTRLIA